MIDLPDTVALLAVGGAHPGADQAAGLRQLMARRVSAPAASASRAKGRATQPLCLGLLAQDPTLAAWLCEQLAVVEVQALPLKASGKAQVLLAVPAHAQALPQSLTWAYAHIKRTAQRDGTLAPAQRLLPRLHLLLVGVPDAALGQQALANLSAAVRQHLSLALPPGAWLCSQDRARLALDFCRLAAELRQWPVT